jgi:Uma2 family endonuclease
MPVSEQTYERVALEDPEGHWELHACGHLLRKPLMTAEYYSVSRTLLHALAAQVDHTKYVVDKDGPRLRIPSGRYYIPDVCVLPLAYLKELRRRPRSFEVYRDPMPLVVEVWSPSTGDYDVDDKLEEYKARGDLEIWRIHPYERTLTAWRLQPDGAYAEHLYTDGTVQPASLPNVTITLAELFE